jgi:CheY-like chemotaxis protein
MILERHAYRVIEAENGEAALDVVERYTGALDLVVTDVVMPASTAETSRMR